MSALSRISIWRVFRDLKWENSPLRLIDSSEASLPMVMLVRPFLLAQLRPVSTIFVLVFSPLETIIYHLSGGVQLASGSRLMPRQGQD